MFSRIRTHASFYYDSPVFNGLEDGLQLIGIPISLTGLYASLFQLDDFHVGHIMAVWIHWSASGPATGNVMKKRTCHVGGTVIILTGPFACIVQCDPFRRFCRNFGVHRIAVEVIFAMPDKAVLIQEAATDHIGQFLSSSTDTQIVFRRRRPALIELFEPVCIGKRSCIAFPFAVRSGLHSIIFGSRRVSKFSVLEVQDILQCFFIKGRRFSTIGRSPVKVLCKSVRIHHIGQLNSI